MTLRFLHRSPVEDRFQQAKKAWEEHWDGCQDCNRFAWEGGLCIEGKKIIDRLHDVADEMEEAGA